MQNQLITTQGAVTRIKQGSFRYVEQVCQEGLGLRYGGAFSAYIEGEAYYLDDGTSELNEGDSVIYTQRYDVDDEFNPISPPGFQQIGVFTVKKCVKGNHTYSFIAYDNLEKLNASYSDKLYNAKASFPMTVQAFLNQMNTDSVADFGVSISVGELYAYNLSEMAGQMLEYFYADGLSYKDILMYFAELSSQYVRCDATGTVHFLRFDTVPDRATPPYWKNSDRYIIAPTDQVTYTGTADIGGTPTTVNLIPIFYKQDGLEREEYHFIDIDRFTIKNIRGEEWMFYQSTVYPPWKNNYVIQKNALVDKMVLSSSAKNQLAGQGMAGVHALYSLGYDLYPFETHLFPFRNPFNAGQILPHIEDADGNRFASVIMKMEQTDSEVILTCSGAERYYTSASDNYDTEENAQALNIFVNDIYGGNVDPVAFRKTLNLGINGALPLTIGQGGTGNTGTDYINNVPALIATANSNSTIVSAYYASWGKLASVELEITRSINTGTTAEVTVATLVSGKRPAVNSPAIVRYAGDVYYAYINTNGQVRFRVPVSIPSGTTLYFNATYLLA